jgi:ribosomal protein S17E
MKCVVLLVGILATCWADSCDDSFGSFLNKLKGELDTNKRDLEVENRDDYNKLVRQCFSDGGDDNKCSLSDDELKTDVYGDSGPLKGCARCQQMAKSFRDKFMHSSESTRKCFRRHFSKAIREELEPCIQGKLSDYNFRVPELPDFDENTFQNIEIVETTVGYHIMARSRLDVCQNVNPSKYSNTGPCLKNGYSGIYSKHCQFGKRAKSSAVSSTCNGRFKTVKRASCDCMEEKRDDWHTKFGHIQKIVNEATSASQCGNDISNEIGAWLNKLQDALKECLPSEGNQQRDLRTLIELGCGQVINGGVKKNELTVGFRFVRLLLDALNDRITVFCDKNCNL